ncbi:HAD family hydrolase [Pseudostreptobacillus hongkongensis]|uniref:HAD family hydrolase n=1 Tax=Pseudostreptobacillus hongkongensis TaxID=1162717 RepID=UPI00082DB733|nr:HAD family phosphatase [Pseudostreptobacillus hongkongensis]
MLDGIKLAIFDMDGLIFDSENLYVNTFPKIFKKYGHNLNKEQVVKTLGQNHKSVREYYTAEFPNIDFDLVNNELMTELINSSNNGNLNMKIGVIELLEYLKVKNIKIAIASSSKREMIELYTKNANIFEYFDYIISGEDVVNSKPDPEIFIKAMKYFNISPKETIIFEDSFNGIIAANKSGAFPIMIPDILVPTEEIRNLTWKVFDNLLDFINECERI